MKEWLYQHLLQLNTTETMNQLEGFTRLGYSQDEVKAMQAFQNIAKSLNMTTERDEAGNIHAVWNPAGSDKSPLAFVSHLDTVTNGGGYDGLAGILCGLGVIKRLQDEKFKPVRPISIICFASEESDRFGVSTLGSKAVAGKIKNDLKESLASLIDKNGVSIREAVESTGLSWDHFDQAEKSKTSYHRVIELHIEQGTQIEVAGKEAAAVQAIACPVRLIVTIDGKSGHTGTTPMHNRQDALLAAAPIISFTSAKAIELADEAGVPLVATVSSIDCSPNAITVIPGRIELGIDIRSVDDTSKEKMAHAIRDELISVEQEFGVTTKVQELVNNPSVLLDTDVHQSLLESIEEAGYLSYSMNSGAGHDIMNMASKWPSGLIFIPCRDGVSHHPSEHASIEDLEKGVTIMTHYAKKEAGGSSLED
ncbi:M20 family metallo-hydrolase [Alkalicoccobacillus murimartini]|uniref:N-carbamoyl-L-amino-acid hydrolase n=1 Tax=Alkalicoccobacillus murimartini TaxID=171685 RepID=A0ABT9YMJ2_9BACI|nr:M20 family metallo-hydrolase [Alkalicoccobacillus murimartini]MDQ0209075.1 N-carbamoyl-L-amino-acid hydrolase [Alkalicoccobacillus murimartini]